MSGNHIQTHSPLYSYEPAMPVYGHTSPVGRPHPHSPNHVPRYSPVKMNGHISRTANTSANKANMSINSGSKQPLLDISRTTNFRTSPQLNGSRVDKHSPKTSASNSDYLSDDYGLNPMLASLALMCLLSILMAFLALFFLQRTCPSLPNEDSNTDSKVTKNANQMRIVSNSREYVRVFQISVSLSTLTIALDLCCLFVCTIQFLSAVKLLKTQFGRKRTFEFLKKTSHIRVAAIGAFLISIPIFFTGVILFTFVNFDEVPALATSFIIGVGIVFCGIASVQTVYLWQWEKTKASQEMSESRIIQMRDSGYLPTIELSTLV